MSDTPTVFDMPPVSAGFDARGGWLLLRLMADLSLTPEQAAGIVGTLAAESGLEAVQEKKPTSGRGGFGWAQWTGPRRVQFEKFSADHDLNVTNDEANHLFLLEELRGPYAHALAQLEKCTAIDSAAYTFVTYFEKPSDSDTETARAIPFAKRAMIAAGHLPPLQVHFPSRVNPWPPNLEPAPRPPSAPAPVMLPSAPITTPAGLTGGALFAYAIVATAALVLGKYGYPIPDYLQNAWLGALIVAAHWLSQTKLFKASRLSKG